MHVHAAVQAGGFQRHIGEGLLLAHQIAEEGGLEAELPLRHQVQAVLGRGITQVIRQQGVDHNTAEGHAVAEQDQPVVFGVLQGFGVFAAGQPGGQGPQHLLQRQLNRRGGIARFVSDGDVGQLIEAVPPTDPDSHQFRSEWVQVCGLRIEGHGCTLIAAAHQPLHQRLQSVRVLNQLRFQLRRGCFFILRFSGGCDIRCSG